MLGVPRYLERTRDPGLLQLLKEYYLLIKVAIGLGILSLILLSRSFIFWLR